MVRPGAEYWLYPSIVPATMVRRSPVKGNPMNLRNIVVIPLVLLSLMNLPAPFAADAPAAWWSVTALGITGLAVAVALVRRLEWAAMATLIVGALNVVGALIALAVGAEGGIIGLTISALIVALAVPLIRGHSRARSVG